MTQTPSSPFNPFGPPVISRQRLYWAWWIGQEATKLFEEYLDMSMEKRGVTENEGEAPVTKTAADGCKPNCCQQACGTDTMSKAAEAAADARKAAGAGLPVPVTKQTPPL